MLLSQHLNLSAFALKEELPGVDACSKRLSHCQRLQLLAKSDNKGLLSHSLPQFLQSLASPPPESPVRFDVVTAFWLFSDVLRYIWKLLCDYVESEVFL